MVSRFFSCPGSWWAFLRPVYLTAGILRMSFRRFILIDAVCATAVVGVFFGLGYAYGDHVTALFQLIRRSEIGLSVAVVTAASVVLCIFLWRRRKLARFRAKPRPPSEKPFPSVQALTKSSSSGIFKRYSPFAANLRSGVRQLFYRS